MEVADHMAQVLNATNSPFVGPPVSPFDRRDHWVQEVLENAKKTKNKEGARGWGTRVDALSHFYAGVGVGILGQHSEVSWDDGFLPLTVRTSCSFLLWPSVCESATAFFSNGLSPIHSMSCAAPVNSMRL
jgi:hypothetical protein